MSSQRFRHESLQDCDSIQSLLDAITQGIAKGKITLKDDDDTIIMEPDGLIRMKLTAVQEDGRNRLDLRLTWQSEDDVPKGKSLKAKAG